MKLWIARDKDKELKIHRVKPTLSEDGKHWINKDGIYENLYYNWFSDITFENSPQQVEIKLLK